ncbi:hypothetical protein [Profundibacter sp.]
MTDKHDEFGLDAYFYAERKATRVPSGDLIARVLADAGAQQMANVPAPAAQPGLFASLWAAIGGWPTAAGMVTATLVGVWIGISPPAPLEQITAEVPGGADDAYLVDLLPAFGDDFVEG